jgi:hypothetical protein
MLAKSSDFFDNVAQIIEQARAHVGRTVDLTMCVTYFEVGRMIVEEEQGGKARAEYGRRLLAELSGYLERRVGRGFSVANLKNARQFFLTYAPSIRQSFVAVLKEGRDEQKRQSMISVFDEKGLSPIRQSMISELYPFKVSWTHYLILMRIKNEQERKFYEIEAVNQQWTVRQPLVFYSARKRMTRLSN